MRSRGWSTVLTAETPDKAGEVFDYACGKPAVQAWSDEIRAASGGKSLGKRGLLKAAQDAVTPERLAPRAARDRAVLSSQDSGCDPVHRRSSPNQPLCAGKTVGSQGLRQSFGYLNRGASHQGRRRVPTSGSTEIPVGNKLSTRR